MAVLSVALSCLPLLDDVTERQPSGGTITWRYGTLWEMAANGAGSWRPWACCSWSRSLAVLLVIATVRVRAKGLPIAIAAHAALLTVMLLTKPGTAEPTPDLTDAGVADVALLVAILATAAVHAVHLHRWRARLGHSLVPSAGDHGGDG